MIVGVSLLGALYGTTVPKGQIFLLEKSVFLPFVTNLGNQLQVGL